MTEAGAAAGGGLTLGELLSRSLNLIYTLSFADI